MADKKEQLAEWDVKEQANPESKELGPLEKLQAMLKEEQDGQVEDFADMLEDLFEDEEEVQASFREAVEQLTRAHQPAAADGPSGGKQTPAAGDGSKDGTAQLPRAAATALLKLAGLGETTAAESDAVESARAERDKEKAEKEAALAEKESALQREKEALAENESALQREKEALAENAELRAQLTALQAAATTPSEGVPSPR